VPSFDVASVIRPSHLQSPPWFTFTLVAAAPREGVGVGNFVGAGFVAMSFAAATKSLFSSRPV